MSLVVQIVQYPATAVSELRPPGFPQTPCQHCMFLIVWKICGELRELAARQYPKIWQRRSLGPDLWLMAAIEQDHSSVYVERQPCGVMKYAPTYCCSEITLLGAWAI
jgi:hypothetical protein